MRLISTQRRLRWVIYGFELVVREGTDMTLVQAVIDSKRASGGVTESYMILERGTEYASSILSTAGLERDMGPEAYKAFMNGTFSGEVTLTRAWRGTCKTRTER